MRFLSSVAAGFVAVAAAISLSSTASASAVYNWVPGAGANQSFTGQLTISDAAYAAGGLAWSDWSDGVGPTPGAMPLEGFSIYGTLTGTDSRGNSFDVFYSNTFDGSTQGPWADWNFSLQTAGNSLVGSLSHNDTASELRMNRGPGDAYWQFTSASLDMITTDRLCNESDEPGSCASLYGNWILASGPPTGVPEPVSAALLAIGLVALHRARRANN